MNILKNSKLIVALFAVVAFCFNGLDANPVEQLTGLIKPPGGSGGGEGGAGSVGPGAALQGFASNVGQTVNRVAQLPSKVFGQLPKGQN